MKPRRVLVVEDEEALGTLLRYNLEREGHTVEWVADGGEALDAMRRFLPEVVVLDWMLPTLSGPEVCRTVPEVMPEAVPHIIMLTARGAEDDRVYALDRGADDYVTKPFSMGELLARVRAAFRRLEGDEDFFEVGDLKIYPSQWRLYREGQEVVVSKKQFCILSFMARRPRRVFSREELLTLFWGHDTDVDLRTVDACMSRLRRALHCPSPKKYFAHSPLCGLCPNVLIALLLILAQAQMPGICSRLAPLHFPISHVRVHTQTEILFFEVEVAANASTQRRGLMCRPHLAPARGMFFVLKKPREMSMWMKNTVIPLDILFVAPSGRIAAIYENAPPLTEDIISSPGAIKAVLELKGGTVGRHKIRVGDVLKHRVFTPD